MDDRKRAFLIDLFLAAVAAADPALTLPRHLPAPPEGGRIIVLAAGKAAGAMAEAAERHYAQTFGLGPDRLTGLAVTRHGYGRPTHILRMVEAGHPVPDHAGIEATAETLRLARSAGPDDLVLVLLSGGGSANWVAPARGLTLADKQMVSRALLASGATIDEINTVRKHLSLIKGGRLAAAVHPARLVTLAISDVPGDDPSVIASGPTVPDPTTLDDARAVLAAAGIVPPGAIRWVLENPASETPKAGDPAFAATDYRIVVRPIDALKAAAAKARATGYEVELLGDDLEGEARHLAEGHVELARHAALAGRKVVFLSGGEVTVTVRGKGRGGPNQEYVLAAAMAAAGNPHISVLAADTDGTDGGSGAASDPAGAFAGPATLDRARALGLDPAAFLAANDSTGFFEALGDLVLPGPTFTNVNDFRAIAVDRIG